MVAIAVPDIGPLVSLVGSVGFSLLGLIVPVAMETVWYWSDEDEDEHDLEQHYWNGTTAATAVDGPTPSTVNLTAGEKRQSSDRGRICRRILRHVKNVFLILLASLALVGGAFYNIRDIVARATDNGTPSII